MTCRPMLHKKNRMQLKAQFESSDVPVEIPPVAEESKNFGEATLPVALKVPEEPKTSNAMAMLQKNQMQLKIRF